MVTKALNQTSTQMSAQTSAREPASQPENPQFFLSVPTQHEPDIFGTQVPQQLTQKDCAARWWPGKDISEAR